MHLSRFPPTAPHLRLEHKEVSGALGPADQLAAVFGGHAGVLGHPLHPVARAEGHLGGHLIMGQTLFLPEGQTCGTDGERDRET